MRENTDQKNSEYGHLSRSVVQSEQSKHQKKVKRGFIVFIDNFEQMLAASNAHLK